MFKTFILLDVLEYNEHWLPYYLHCLPCHLNYTMVAKTETLPFDSQQIMQVRFCCGCFKMKNSLIFFFFNLYDNFLYAVLGFMNFISNNTKFKIFCSYTLYIHDNICLMNILQGA